MKIIFTLTLVISSLLSVSQPGSLLTTFGTEGKVITDIGSNFDVINGLAIQPDGKIVTVGTTGMSPNYNFAVARYNIDGTLDPTFNTTGIVITAISSLNDSPKKVLIQNDGKIVVSGGAYNGTQTGFCLVRYNSNGSLDNTFDTDGIAFGNFPVGYAFAGNGLAILEDGKFLVAGSAIGDQLDFALARFNSNGSIDSTFGTNGYIQTPIEPGTIDRVFDLAVRGDGKIILAGTSRLSPTGVWRFAIACYNSDGSINTSFANDGKFIYAPEAIDENIFNSIAIQNDGKIIAVGSATLYSTPAPKSNLFVSRVTIDGKLDSTFDGDGILMADFYGFGTAARQVKIQHDGKIIVAGSTFINLTDAKSLLVRFNIDGSPDVSFGTGGRNIVDIAERRTSANVIELSGNLIFAGGTSSLLLSSNIDFFLTAHINDAFALPLKFISFTVSTTKEEVLLEWQTAREVNTSHFIAEKSTDGQNFISFGSVKARTGSNVESHYSIKGNQVQSSYYRIKAVDNDGMFSYSKTVFLKTDNLINRPQIFPNPAKDVINVYSLLEGNVSIIIYDVNGRVIRKIRRSIIRNGTFFPFEISALAKGVYSITLKTSDKSEKSFFIKE